MGCDCCEGKCGKDVRVSFCPRCKSRSVGYVFGFGNVFGVIPKMKCRDCGMEAPTFPILVASQESIKKAVGEMKTRRRTSRVSGKRLAVGGRKVVKKKVKTRNSVSSKMRTKVRSSLVKKKVVKRK